MTGIGLLAGLEKEKAIIKLLLFVVLTFNLLVANGKEMNTTFNDPRAAQEEVHLHVEAVIQGDVVHISYSVSNARKQAIYIMNKLWSMNKIGDYIEPILPAYVCITENNLGHFLKGISPLPQNQFVEMRIIPFATKVEAGGKYSESFKIPLPIDEYNPYFPANNDSTYQLNNVGGLIFTLQFLSELEGLIAKEAPLDNGLLLMHPRLLAEFETLQSERIELQMPIRKRLDYFECF